MLNLPQKIKNIAHDFESKGIEVYVVGGMCRNHLMHKFHNIKIPQKDDIDITLVGVKDKNIVMDILSKHTTKVAQEVGNQFPVWIANLNGLKVDIALARKESSNGSGDHRDFSVVTEGVTIEDDLFRRDFTINAIAFRIVSETFVSFSTGIEDCKNLILRAVSDHFGEDALRVLRGARFTSYFNLKVHPSFIDVAIELKDKITKISPERIGGELQKVMKYATKPSVFFQVLKNCEWLEPMFPEIFAMILVSQDAVHHPEGDVFNHTMLCVDESTNAMVRMVMLLHDTGKVSTTTINGDGKIQAIGHEDVSVEIAESFLKRFSYAKYKKINQIKCLVGLHMVHVNAPLSDKMVRKTYLALKEHCLSYHKLVEVCRCDVSGRFPKPKHTPDIGQFRYKNLIGAEKSSLKPIITGDDLIKNGWKPSPDLGKELKRLFELQLDGLLTVDKKHLFITTPKGVSPIYPQ